MSYSQIPFSFLSIQVATCSDHEQRLRRQIAIPFRRRTELCQRKLPSFFVPSNLPFGRASSSDIQVVVPDEANESLTVSYLFKSCGLSSEYAVSAAKGVSLNSTNAAAILLVFRSYGFSDAHITQIISKRPKLLRSNPEKTLKPKLEFLCDAGFKNDEIASILVANQSLMARSLQNFFVPVVLFLKSNITSRSKIVHILKHIGCLSPKLEYLRCNGIPDSITAGMLTWQPRILNHNIGRLRDAFNTVKEMGMDTKSKMFGFALCVMFNMSKSTLLRKVEFFHGLGWSDEEISLIFCKHPGFFTRSTETILKRLEYYRESVGWDKTMLLKHPVLLTVSLEKRIIPRVSVLKILTSRGFIPEGWGAGSLYISNENFFRRYVEMYGNAIPEVVDAYQPALRKKVDSTQKERKLIQHSGRVNNISATS